VWARDKRYQKLLKNIENGRSFPNIPEWANIESQLIHMTNDIGALYRLSWNNDSNLNLKLAAIILDYHRKINHMLKASESRELSLTSMVSILEEPVSEEIFIPKRVEKSPATEKEKTSESDTFNWFLLFFIFVSCAFILFTEHRFHLIKGFLSQRQNRK
jgi:multiple sugar transport system substrate-binding protein